MEILKMTATELGASIKNGDVTVREALDAYFEKIEKYDTTYHCYNALCKDEAYDRADEVQKGIDEGKYTSPLAGVPIGIKDNICTKGIKTTCSSKILCNFVPPYNATVIERLEAAGMVVIGKLNMDEFAMGSTSETSYFGPVRNPRNLSRVPGGSSGGAAAAVAGKMAVAALGSDTGGSVRLPASYCGVTGFKPTYGTVSRFGLIAYASSFDQIGPVARDAADCAAIMDIISGKDSLDSTSLDTESPGYLASLTGEVKGMKIGIPKECFISSGLNSEVAEKVMAAAEVLKNAGAETEEISLPFLRYAVPAYYIIASAEASSNLSRYEGVKYGYWSENFSSLSDLYSSSRSRGFGKEVKKRILLGTFVLSGGYYDRYYLKAQGVRAKIKKNFDEIFSRYDLILCPSAPDTAPESGRSLDDPLKMYLSDIFTVSANLAGLPAISFPCGNDSRGMPVGVQIIGKSMDDVKVLNAAHAYQKLTDFHKNFAEVK